MNKSLSLAIATTFASGSVFAHNGTHPDGILTNLAHLWTHLDHWGPAMAVLAGLAILAPAAGRAVSTRLTAKDKQSR
ncbi:hypothetical protein BST95_05105 [Halioglobus japonicus]|uniref:Uncharacterized protein n=1 Tax=Halioglobus japonicus TaxID=930805 RepID=A0AAP8MDA0_9GAMM|nr:hypothetical protein [Halioglobus japonicus]AQA17705.1 hypothetical protein BST95_05105 [Halioglobus japonicus]PLW85656.1 hypothetical protein C0029_13670 [Halioglobus japonicus]GHD16783.1 hypothetical protein GCM10007052_22580 [Halioglobus japonicus]